MCKVWDEIRQMGIAEGEIRGEIRGEIKGTYNTNLNSLKNIMLKLNMNLKEAMELLGISIEEYDRYASVLMK